MRQKGFTLIEVLVAMVVLSIGLLGLAGMMATTMRNNHSAYHRTQATWMAYDMLDRIRANREVALAGSNNYNIAVATPAPASTTPAGEDLVDWKGRLAANLPGGDGAVTVTPATRAVTIIIQWNDSRGTGGNNSQQFRVDSQL